MSDIIVQLSLDKTGRNPNNLMEGEEHILEPILGFPYGIITLYHGGFYINDLKVYDEHYNLLKKDIDYIVTYNHKNASENIGLDICSAIVIINNAISNKVYTSAQMVGGDLAFSFTVITDYVNWFNNKEHGYIPSWKDYNGNEPIWKPGELAEERWHLDTYQPFNNEIDNIARAVSGGVGEFEDAYRARVKQYYDDFLDRFDDRLELHINDEANPHRDTKNHIGLRLVNNFRVANENEARVATANNLYLTPALSFSTVDEHAVKPLNAHLTSINPHKTDAAKINAPTKMMVDNTAENKYGRNDTVVGSNFADWNGRRDYESVLSGFRAGIPASNFIHADTHGYLAPQRIGSGAPSAGRVLRSNGTWTTWEAIFSEYGASMSSGTVDYLTFSAGTTQAQAHNFILNTPALVNRPVGSIIFYNIYVTLAWAYGNGGYVTYNYFTFASMRTNSGWVAI